MNAKPFPRRRKNRLTCIRYNENGAYFITICTEERRSLFWNSASLVGAALRRPPVAHDSTTAPPVPGSASYHPSDYLNSKGIIVLEELNRFHEIYMGIITVDNYVIMPNHVHLLLSIHPEKVAGLRDAAPTISAIINQFKGCVTKRIGAHCWQKSFHDHVVRNEDEYRRIWEYIDNNPALWMEDRYYTEQFD